MQTDDPDRILRINVVLDRSGLSRSTLYRKMQDGTFPPNIKISTRCAGWRESAVAEWQSNPRLYRWQDSEAARRAWTPERPDECASHPRRAPAA